MFATWLVEEVWYNVDTLYHGDLIRASSCPGLITIGYREVVAYLQWTLSLPVCIALVQQHNRNYAKRQITWNKKYET
jgi:tRNA dimethylallyltransferase